VIRFDDDIVTQINLSHYDINNLTRGYAFTIHALQGSEIDHVLYYIHAGFSNYHDRRLQYVACSRARKSIVIECAFPEDATDLSGSDVARICSNVPRQSTDTSLIDYLPAFRGDEMYFESVRAQSTESKGKKRQSAAAAAPKPKNTTIKKRKTDSYSTNESSDIATNSE
jgi:ATP-dependent exoDNAse (exonuclease V) beta subunit